jgi:L-cysteine S-thiosulfotransferase
MLGANPSPGGGGWSAEGRPGGDHSQRNCLRPSLRTDDVAGNQGAEASHAPTRPPPAQGRRRPPSPFGGGTKKFGVTFWLIASLNFAAASAQEALRPYTVVGDAIPASLTGAGGDPARGRAIVVNRQVGLCLLCHSGPFPEERFQGSLAPDLKGAGARWSEGQLRLRIVDAAHLNPDTIMPPYYRVDGFQRVAPAFRGKPVLTAEQIEDVVAFLVTLRD